MKSYNIQALRGNKYDDREFQADMAGAGIDIPDSLLYTPNLGPYVINQVHQQTMNNAASVMNPETGQPFTPDEAKAMADEHRASALKNYSKLLNVK